MARILAFPSAPKVMVSGPDAIGNFTTEVQGWTGHPENQPRLVTKSRDHALDFGAFLRDQHRLPLDSSGLQRIGFTADHRLLREPYPPEIDEQFESGGSISIPVRKVIPFVYVEGSERVGYLVSARPRSVTGPVPQRFWDLEEAYRHADELNRQHGWLVLDRHTQANGPDPFGGSAA